MKKFYVREYYYERDDWACPARKRFVLEVESLEAGKRWCIEEIKQWEKDGVKKSFTVVECDEIEYRISEPELIRTSDT